MMTPHGTGVLVANGAALAWTLFLLAEHPEVANDLVDELTSLLHGEASTVEQLGKLPLLGAVVKERFRTARWSTLEPTVYEYNPISAGPRMRVRKAEHGRAAARRALPPVRGSVRRLVELGS